jgi:hypothetical protein
MSLTDSDFRSLTGHKEAIERSLRLLQGLETLFRSEAEADTNQIFKNLMNEIADGIDATIHDACLEWFISNISEAEGEG